MNTTQLRKQLEDAPTNRDRLFSGNLELRCKSCHTDAHIPFN